jgi:hypothetical protein
LATHDYVRSTGVRLEIAIVGILFCAGAITGQEPDGRIAIQIRETAGLRRFGYPVTARIELASGALRAADKCRLVGAEGKAISVQLTPMESHPDGSIRILEADFNLSPGPLETVPLSLEYGGGITVTAPVKGLTLSESPDSFQVTAYRIRKDANPLIASVRYGREYLKDGGLNVIAWQGKVERALRDAKLSWKIEKQGPLQVRLRCEGQHAERGEVPALPFQLTLTFVSSKSWVGVDYSVQSSPDARHPIALAVSANFALAGRLLWDADVGYLLYGVLASGEQMLMAASGNNWSCRLGTKAQEILYAASTPSGRGFLGWGHFQESREDGNVVAFGVSQNPPGLRRIELGSGGSMLMKLTPADSAARQMTSFFHFIPVPLQHTARTSPPSMMMPLEVTISGKKPS